MDDFMAEVLVGVMTKIILDYKKIMIKKLINQ